MRRKDREIRDFDEIVKIIKKCDVCRIAFNDGEYPYMIPLNFGLDVTDGQIFLYFHSALEGKKIDLIKEQGQASFEMDCGHQLIMYDDKMSCTMGYESVMGRGEIEILPEEERIDGLKILMRQYHEESFPINEKMAKVTHVLRMKVTSYTGKRRDNVHPGEKGRTPHE